MPGSQVVAVLLDQVQREHGDFDVVVRALARLLSDQTTLARVEIRWIRTHRQSSSASMPPSRRAAFQCGGSLALSPLAVAVVVLPLRTSSAFCHEFVEAGLPAPPWTKSPKLATEWVLDTPRLSEGEIRRQTPDWLAERNIFIAVTDLVTL